MVDVEAMSEDEEILRQWQYFVNSLIDHTYPLTMCGKKFRLGTGWRKMAIIYWIC